MRYTIRELKLGEILDQAVNLTKDHFGVLLGITGALLIPFYLISGLIQVTMMPKLPPNPTPEQAMAALFTTFRITIPTLVVAFYIIIPITNAALIYAISNAYLEKSISVRESFRKAFQRFLPLIGTWFLVGLAIMGGMILCLVPGILAAFWFALATQVVVIEGRGGFTAMKRSKQLMAGNIGTAFALGLLLGIINGAIRLRGRHHPPTARTGCHECDRHGCLGDLRVGCRRCVLLFLPLQARAIRPRAAGPVGGGREAR